MMTILKVWIVILHYLVMKKKLLANNKLLDINMILIRQQEIIHNNKLTRVCMETSEDTTKASSQWEFPIQECNTTLTKSLNKE